MNQKNKWCIAEFTASFNRKAFSCGNQELDEYLRTFASQDIKRRIARVFVAYISGSSDIIGYYTISAASYNKESLPKEMAKKLPYYPVPAVIIGRFAIERTWQGKGLGEYMLMDAMDRILRASQVLAINIVTVDAKDERAKSFYMRYGFIPFPKRPLQLFIPVKTIEKMIL